MQDNSIHKPCAGEKESEWPTIIFDAGLSKALTRLKVDAKMVPNQLRRGAEVGHHLLDYVGTA